MKVFFTTILFLCYGTSFAQNDSTFFFIERNGLFAYPFVLSTDFKIYGLSKCDTFKNTYQEIKIRWLKSPKTKFTGAGVRIDTSDIQGDFLVAVNFPLPKHLYVHEKRNYLFECHNNYLHPGKTFVLESYIHKWNVADYVDIFSTGIISDSLIKIDIKSRNKPIATVTGSIPKVILEGDFNDDGYSDFVLEEGNRYKMYVTKNQSFTPFRCKLILGDIFPEF